MKQQPWVIDGQGFSGQISGKLLTHCFIMMFLGFSGGFVWLIHLADNLFHVLPLPRIEIAVPDQRKLLRIARTGPITNAMDAMAIVLLSPRLNFSARQAKRVYYGIIATLWGNLIGYTTALFAPERGLQLVSDWPKLASYATFYIAVIGVVIATGICLFNAIRAARYQRS